MIWESHTSDSWPAIDPILCAYGGLLFIPIKKQPVLSIPKKKNPILKLPEIRNVIYVFYRFGVHELFQSERGRKRERIATPDQALSDLAGAWEEYRTPSDLLSCQQAHIVLRERELYICTLRTALREPGSNIIHLVRFHFDNHQLRGSHEKNIPVDVIIMREAIDTRKFRVRPSKAWSILF